MGDENLRRELEYYKRHLDELAAARVTTEHRQWMLQAQLRQKKQGFLLLSRLSQTVGAQTDLAAMFRVTALAINAVLGMDRTLVFVPQEGGRGYRAAHFAGLAEDSYSFAFTELRAASDLLLVRRSTTETPTIASLRERFGLASFVCLPVAGPDGPVGIILSGRLREDATFCPPLDEGDADTFRAIAGVLAAAVQNTRLSRLEQTQRLKAELYTNVSHELRTPLTLTLGPLAQVLAGRWGALPEPVSERLRVVERNQTRLLTLVNEILDLARLQAGAAELDAAPIASLNALVHDCVAHFRPAAEVRGIEVRLRLDPALDPGGRTTLHADRERLERLLFNLLSNALKFTGAGHVEVSTRRLADAVELAVSDTGIGLSSEDIARLYTRFGRVAPAQAARAPSSGLGLALVKEIATLHGGQVSVESEPGKGARFVVTLPLGQPSARAHEHAGAARPDPAVAASAPAPDPRVLVDAHNREAEAGFDATRAIVLCVEDDADLRAYVRDVLGADFNVFVAADGADGLELARRYVPDLVVADQMMPRMSGPELLAALRADAELAAIPVAFLTARHDRQGRLASLGAGADDYITKPFDEDELRARVRNLVLARARERQLAEANRRLELRVREQMAELVHTGEIKRFLPRSVVATLERGALARGSDLDQRAITVLVADVVGWTPAGDRLSPQQLSGVLDDYLGAVATIAAAHGGTIDSLAGGRVSVLFGAPEPAAPEVSAWSAVKAAFELRARLLELAAGARRRGLDNAWRIRVGVASGMCLVGALGGELLRTYTAVGPAVAQAAALEASAAPGSIVCSSATWTMIQERVAVRALAHDGYELTELPVRGPARAPEPSAAAAASLAPALPVAASRSEVGAEASASRAFRREGDYWTIAYGGSIFRLRDAKGLEYLAHLLARPGTEVHVLDLVAPLRDQGACNDAGAILDATAKAAYRNRLRELDDELEEARRFGDGGRVARAEEEVYVLARQLSAAVGLGGRDRKAASLSERARINVTRAIKSSIERIAHSSSELARHLGASVRTGTFCSYSPHPGVPDSWDVMTP